MAARTSFVQPNAGSCEKKIKMPARGPPENDIAAFRFIVSCPGRAEVDTSHAPKYSLDEDTGRIVSAGRRAG